MIENYLTSAGISARQYPPINILVLVQETPFTDSRYKEINGLLKKGVFTVIIKKKFCKAFVYLTRALLIKLSTLVLTKPLKSQGLLYKLIIIRERTLSLYNYL